MPDEQLTAYAERDGFAFIFAVAPPELLRALVEVFGRVMSNPPSTPHFLIRPDGSTTLVTGSEPFEAILAHVIPKLNL